MIVQFAAFADVPPSTDGTIVLLELRDTIKPDDAAENWFALGHNNKAETGIDCWQCIGWHWQEGAFGTFQVPALWAARAIINWMPFDGAEVAA